MNGRLSSPLSDFARFVEEHLGLHDENPTTKDWDTIYRERLVATKSRDFASYKHRLTALPALREEIAQLAQRMTIGETYFFRDSRQFEALTTVIFPELIHHRADTAKLQILSVACSTGEEPYSVAIAARELLGDRANRIRIHAFDINRNVITRAERGIYSEWALRATPASIRERHFKKQGNQYTLSETIRNAVSFEVRNLFEDDAEFWQPRRFDVILCRNALIYFSRRKITTALSRFADVLATDGTLFLGNAETPRGYEDRLIPQELCGSFCYRLTLSENANHLLPPLPPTQNIAIANVITPVLEAPTAFDFARKNQLEPWVTAIDDATRRLATLVERTPSQASRQLDVVAPSLARRTSITDALKMIATERFGEALFCLDELATHGHDPAELGLLRATILTNQGRLVDAMDICQRLLVDDPHCAGAYHLLGVSCEHLGKHTDARNHHEMAVTLDPNFAMSHWFLGRLFLRAQLREPARRHLSIALELWQIESPTSKSNIALFTGGFGRETLQRLCRSDLATCDTRRR